VTAVRPDVRRRDVRRNVVSILDRRAISSTSRLLEADPYANVVVAARLRSARSLAPAQLGGTMIGIADGDELTAACYSGGNLLPIGGDAPAWDALARFVAERPRVCSSIVGRAEAVEVMWSRLIQVWGPARCIRTNQPLLMLDHAVDREGDESVVPAKSEDLDRYVCAAAAMFTEELGVSPHVSPGSAPFRSRVAELIANGRAFASLDFRGQVVFKAEIGAVSGRTAQVQGVWVRPDLRGRGIGTAGLATVLTHALTLAPTVSLYVNDFNVPAMKAYRRLGMRQVATLSTVLLT
jgi:hypothetical protein